MDDIMIDVERILEKQEYDLNGESLGEIGSTTIRFNDPKSARKAAIATFKKYFAPGWVLISSDYASMRRVVAQT